MSSLTTMNIKVISKEIIEPSIPTPNHLRSLPASLFDQINSPILTPMIFFFNPCNNINTASGNSANKFLDRLKASLGKTLSVFYPLAGRIQNANHIICNDEGVPYVRTEVDKPLKDIVHKAEVSQLDKLLPPYREQAYTRLLLAIQVNVFACGGLAVGVMMNHAIADSFSLFTFVKTWASIANGKDPHTLLHRPYFDIWTLFPPTSPHIHDVDLLHPNMKSDGLVTKWFLFSEAKLNSIRSKILPYINFINKNSNLSDSEISPPSLPMVLSAFLWSRIMVACHSNVNTFPSEVSHAVDLRSSVSLPDKNNSYYFGNMYTVAIGKPSSFVFNQDNTNSYYDDEPLWCEFLQQSENSVKKTTGKDECFITKVERGEEDLSSIKEYFHRKSRGETISVNFRNLQILQAYEADFGCGKPVWVATGSQKFKDLVMLIRANPSSKDIIAYASLADEDMAKLESDAKFNSIVSKAPRVRSKL